MKSFKALTAFFALALVFATPAVAQDAVAGIWRDNVFTLTLTTDGNMLAGTVAENGIATRQLSDGTIDGAKLRFTTVARLNGEDRVLEWLGEVVGNRLTLTRNFSSVPGKKPYRPFNGPFVLQRQ